MANTISSQFLGLNTFTPVIPVGPAAPYGSPPQGEADDSSDKSNKSKSTSVGGLDENMIKWLYEKGLASDVAAFFQQAESAINNAYNPITGKPTLAAYKLIIPKLAQIRQEREAFDKATEQMRNNNALSEAAINIRGEVYVADPKTNSIITKSIDDVTSADRLITNGELAQYRMNNPGAAFNTDLTSTVNNGIGMSKVTEYLLKNIAKLGTTTEQSENFVDTDGNAIKGAKILQEMMQAQKGIVAVKQYNKDQVAQAQYALSYIMDHMPQNSNMAAALKLQAKLAGKTPQELVSELIMSQMNSETRQDVSITKTGSNSDKDKAITMNAGMMYQTGQGGIKNYLSIVPGRINGRNTVSTRMQVQGLTYPQLLGANNQVIKDGSLEQVLNDGVGVYTNTSNGVYIGDQYVPEYEFSQVLVNTKNVSRAWMPFTRDEHGVIHPDFALIDEFVIVTNKLKNIKDKDEQVKYIRGSAFADYFEGFDNNGNIVWNSERFMPFMLLNVMADADDQWFGDGKAEDAVLSESSRYTTNVEELGMSKEQVRRRMREVLGNQYRGVGEVYAGVAYLPMSHSTAMAMVGSGEAPKYYQNETNNQDEIRRIDAQDNKRTFNTASSSILF